MRSPSDIFEERRKELGLSEFFRGPTCAYCGDEIVEKQNYIVFHFCDMSVPHLKYGHMNCARKNGWKVKEG